ncbi:MAG: Lrp/AsnC family transcriptional regulator [Candidatus Bathyarchaeia archaeon]
MKGLLTSVDIKILQALCEVGPRNLSKVARIVGIPRHRLDFRLKQMQSNSQFFLRIHTCVYHTKIGLRKAVVFMRAKPGMEQLLFDCLKVNGFWLYVCRSYGMGEGCTAVYAVPAERRREFEEFIYEIRRLGVAEDARIFWSTCFQSGRITADWFDGCKEKWVFPWDDWIKEVQTQTTDLPYTLMEPKSYAVCGDEIDVQMLMWLEADATRSIKEIAEKVGISPQLALFHFKNHLLKRNLIEGYEIFVMRYGDVPSVMVVFVVSFSDYEKLAKFARSLLGKFFVLVMGKILGENSLFLEVFLPMGEFRKFVDALSSLAGMGWIQSYVYAIQDLRVRQRQTFSGEFFKGGSWVYDHKGYIKALRQKVTSRTSPSMR